MGGGFLEETTSVLVVLDCRDCMVSYRMLVIGTVLLLVARCCGNATVVWWGFVFVEVFGGVCVAACVLTGWFVFGSNLVIFICF